MMLDYADATSAKRRVSRGRWDGVVRCTVVHAETGRIRSTPTAVWSQIADQSRPGDGTFIVIGAYDEATTWFPQGEPEDRPKHWTDLDRMIIADGVDAITVDVPGGARLGYEWPAEEGQRFTHHRRTITVDEAGDTVRVATVVPGVYRLHLWPAWPYQDQVITITAVAP